MRALPWPGPPETDPARLLAPGDVDWPVADVRCMTCMHPHRELIEAHLDAGTRPPMIVRILESRGIPSPGEDSIRNHGRRHRVAPAQARRVREATQRLDRHAEALDTLRHLWEETARHMADGSPAHVLPVPASSPADERLVSA